jgi:hypothetical protein
MACLYITCMHITRDLHVYTWKATTFYLSVEQTPTCKHTYIQSATCRNRLTNACIHCEQLRSYGVIILAAWRTPTYIYPRQCGAQRRENVRAHTCKYIHLTFMNTYKPTCMRNEMHKRKFEHGSCEKHESCKISPFPPRSCF